MEHSNVIKTISVENSPSLSMQTGQAYLAPSTNALFFVLAVYGATLIITQSTLFEPLRNWLDKYPKLNWLATLVGCPMCAGFWVGVLHALFIPASPLLYAGWLGVFLSGCAASGVCWIIHTLVSYIESMMPEERG